MTDTETKVRRIAEWMGSAAKIVDRYERDQDGTVAVIHDIDPLDSAADRERVMLAMHNKVSHTPYDFGDGNYGWLITERLVNPHLRHIWEADVGSPSLGLAFIDAVCQYLDAQAGE